MESNNSARERDAADEASSETETQMVNGAESLEDLNKCESAGSKKNDTSTSIVPSEAIIAETGADNYAAVASIFPPEVVIEILCWLPLRSLGKLQLVCKEWRGFIRGRYLMERNVGRRVVTCHWHNVEAPERDRSDESFLLLDGCDGLLLLRSFLRTKFTIWNPATLGVFHLPDPHKDAFAVTFSYVKSTGNYLVVSLYKDESRRESCEVLTLGPSESWRPLAFPDVAEHGEKLLIQVVSTGEAVHTVLSFVVGSTVTRNVVSLDLETECFTVTCFTKTLLKNSKNFRATDWNGKLALTNLVGNNLHVTELEDYKKQRWCQKKMVIPLSFLEEENEVMSLVPLFVKDGDIWFSLEETAIIIYTIETRRTTLMNSSRLTPAGKLYPYIPTLASFQGMQQDSEFGKRWSSSLKLD